MNIKLEWLESIEGKSKEELSSYLDQEIEEFSKYMEQIADIKSTGPLHPMEKMLVKTYLIYKLKTA